jgi:pyrroloquinoline quinone (PQQ) biosynthesis protein C
MEALMAAHMEVETGSSPEGLVAIYEQVSVADHPYFRRLAAEPVSLAALWHLMANIQEGVSRNFTRWLAETVARVEDRRVASIIAHQLNDELGNGDFSQIHSRLLDRFVTALAPYRPERGSLAPGIALGRRMNQIFDADDPYEGVGALMISEIYAQKLDHCIGDEVRRQSELDEDSLTWLVLHEQLEDDHAGESRVLARVLADNPPTVPGAIRGGQHAWQVLWTFLDEMNQAWRLSAV